MIEDKIENLKAKTKKQWRRKTLWFYTSSQQLFLHPILLLKKYLS